MPFTAEQLVDFLRDALANRPQDTYSDEALAWYADVVGAVAAHDGIAAIKFQVLLPSICNTAGGIVSPMVAGRRDQNCREFLIKARALHTQLQLATNVFVTRQLNQGQVHSYFDEIRQIIGGAARDVLFIDPYINADFVTRYLPVIPQGVATRLLTSSGQMVALRASLDVYQQEHGGAYEARSFPNGTLHDRHLVIDSRDVYQSGASFKDGARNAPTSINQIVDVATEMIAAHEAHWAAAQPVGPHRQVR